MDISDLIAGVFAGNLLTAAFLWGAMQSRRFKGADAPWLVLAALALPLLFALGSFIVAGELPPSLDALAAR